MTGLHSGIIQFALTLRQYQIRISGVCTVSLFYIVCRRSDSLVIFIHYAEIAGLDIDGRMCGQLTELKLQNFTP